MLEEFKEAPRACEKKKALNQPAAVLLDLGYGWPLEAVVISVNLGCNFLTPG